MTNTVWFFSHVDPRLTIVYAYMPIYLYACVLMYVWSHETKVGHAKEWGEIMKEVGLERVMVYAYEGQQTGRMGKQ